MSNLTLHTIRTRLL